MKPRPYQNIVNFMNQAKAAWGDMNVKIIGAGEIEDFLFGLTGISEKTRSNYKSGLHDFWAWLKRREDVPTSGFPEVSFTLFFRKIVGKETHVAILEKFREMFFHHNPRI